MRNTLQLLNWRSRMRLPAASAALVLATVLVAAVSTTQSAQAQTLTVLYSFDGTDEKTPVGALVQATNGKFYGTTEYGSANGDEEGTVFEITPNGTLTTLLNFDNTNGNFPYAGLVQDSNGDLYGTTYGPAGTVFKITPSGTLTTLHSFDYTDGEYPTAGLVQATNGDLYGTTSNGGEGYGTVFKITPSGTLTTLHSFDYTDGDFSDLPAGGLVQANNGDLYGTTAYGGANLDGTVFKITPTGTFTTLYSFCSESNCTDGKEPTAGLVQATNGDLYGTTAYGGANNGGTVFKITPSGTLTTLYSFCSESNCADGQYPSYTGLVQATDGNLYGVTGQGGGNTGCGSSGCGTAFKITPTGTLTTVYYFCSALGRYCNDGSYPVGLVQYTNGDLYGTTGGGGANNDGTVFSLSGGLGPFVETLPTSGKVGAAVKILGTKLTGATSVKFNGKAAVFKVVSASLITTTVPTGAITGTVDVTTPKGTLKSNVVFRVTK